MTGDRPQLASGTLGAMALAAAAAGFNAVDAVIVRAVSDQMHPFAIGLFRSAFGLLAVLPWIVSRSTLAGSSYRWLHVLRAGIKLLSLVAFYATFAAADLADATATMFTAPLFLILGAWAVLGERLDALRLAGIVAGFAGALIIIRPDGGSPRRRWSSRLAARR